jgi:tetratricopeptide (TPR) repeat protein
MKTERLSYLPMTWAALMLIGLLVSPVSAVRLANQHKRGLYITKPQEILRLNDRDIDIGTAALVVSENWSDSVQGVSYRQQLDTMAEEILLRLKEQRLRPNAKAIPVINHYLFEELGFQTVPNADNPEDLFLHSVLDKRKGYCLSLSILYLSLAERIGLPLSGVVVPGHFFVRYDSPPFRFNIETTAKGGSASDQHYKETYKVPTEEYHSLYMKNLTKQQALGCLFNNLGVVYLESGQSERALIALDLAVGINPMLSEARANMGNIYLRQGLFQEAIIQFVGALDINPNDPKTHYNLANAYAQVEQFRQAESHFKQTIQLDSNFVSAYAQLGQILNLQKKHQQAKIHLNSAISRFPANAELLCELAHVYRDAGNYNQALNFYRKSTSLNPNHISSVFGKGICFNKLGMPNEEMEAYRQVILLDPENYAALVNLGHVYLNKKLYSDAVTVYTKALTLSDYDPWIYQNLGFAYTELNEPGNAITQFQRAIGLDASMGDSHFALAVTFFNHKQYESAWDHVNKAKQLGTEVPEDLFKAISRKVKQ